MNWTSNPRPRYISGSISNGGTKTPSFEGFNEAEKRLREEGFEVLNPANWEQDEEKPWEWYLARDLKLIYETRPVMYMLAGWSSSLGARLEKEWAELLSLEIEYEQLD